MARIRTIKPEFFTDEEVAAMSPLARIAFEGLWCHADREGRLKDRPVRLKAQILPYDDVDMIEILDEIERHHFIRRYTVDGLALIYVRTLKKHQQIPSREPESVLPPPPDHQKHVPSSASTVLEHVPSTGEGKGREGKGSEGNGSLCGLPSAQCVVDVWNQLVTPPIPKVTKLTNDRRTKINARLKIYPDLAIWRTVITWLNGQEWCRAPGTGDHPNWTATLDWLCRNDGTLARYVERAATPVPTVPRQPRVGPDARWSPSECWHTPQCANHEQHKAKARSDIHTRMAQKAHA